MEEKKGTKLNFLGKIFKKYSFGLILFFYFFLAVYCQMTDYFLNHFYPGTEINSINVSGKSLDGAKYKLNTYLNNYTLTFKERGGKSQHIKGSDISLTLASEDDLKKIRDSQLSNNWFFTLFCKDLYKINLKLSYDENLFKEKVEKMSCFKKENIVEPQSPTFQYTDKGYIIISEILGNQLDKDLVCKKATASILNGDVQLDLEANGCYLVPTYTSTSKKITDLQVQLNKYASTKVTYNFGLSSETIDGGTISKWLYVNNNFEAVIDEKKVSDYMDKLSISYNTAGKVRSFTTTQGNVINIQGGDYGWIINKSKESQNLIDAIKNGKTLSKEPEYSQVALFHSNKDFGNTYVEINLSSQHMWYYKNGSLIVHGSIVTGNVSNGNGTPRGIYSLKYRQRNAVLKGPGYEAPVNFWMPFNGGIGIHDASWRGAFGGSIYVSNGSHGCINTSYGVAQAIFNNIDINTPVICY